MGRNLHLIDVDAQLAHEHLNIAGLGEKRLKTIATRNSGENAILRGGLYSWLVQNRTRSFPFEKDDSYRSYLPLK